VASKAAAAPNLQHHNWPLLAAKVGGLRLTCRHAPESEDLQN